MPRLVKGGKFVYGISKIGAAGNIVIPPPAMEEYRFRVGDRVILINGSRRSGGFAITMVKHLAESRLGAIVKALPELVDYRLPEHEIVQNRGRLFCWTQIGKDGGITASPEALSRYGLKVGDLLVVVRGSGLAIGFVAKGPVFEEAMKHPELQLFQ